MEEKETEGKRIIAVGMDGSDFSWKALDMAITIAKVKKAPLHIISIQETIHTSFSRSEVLAADQTAKHKLEKIQKKARNQCEEEGVHPELAICVGHPAGALVTYVKENGITMLVVGDRGHASIWGSLLGTTAEKIVHDCPCSVLVVR